MAAGAKRDEVSQLEGFATVGNGLPVSRERNPHVKRASPLWNQAKLSRLEAGKIGKVKIEAVFELALALDVSPLHLIGPSPR